MTTFKFKFSLLAILLTANFSSFGQTHTTDCSGGSATTPTTKTIGGKTMKMVWHDEFDGTEIDPTKWQACPEWKRQGGSYWEADNAWLNGCGKLKMKVSQKGDSVFCGAIRTRNLYDQKYGYFEVRCKVPQIHGGWAAFWMMPYGNHPGDQGNDGTEIDIFESINGWNNKIQHAIHWDGYGAEHQHQSKSMDRPDIYDDKMHTFGMKWTPTEYTFYIDDVETWRTSAGGVSDVAQYLKLTMEVSNQTWPGDWNNQITKPIVWTVDYVRTYSLEEPDCNGDFGGTAYLDDCGTCVGGLTGKEACLPCDVSSETIFSEPLYTQTGEDKTWQCIIDNNEIPIGVKSTEGITGSGINVKNSLVEVGKHATNPIIENLKIHTLGNSYVSRTYFDRWSRWYQEDGNTQIFRLFKDEVNVRNDRDLAARIETFYPEKRALPEPGVWHEWEGRYTIVNPAGCSAPHYCSIFQAKGNSVDHWSVMVKMDDKGNVWMDRRGDVDTTFATNMIGKAFDLKVRDNGMDYEVYVGDKYIGNGTWPRTEEVGFRWGIYVGESEVKDDILVFVTGAKNSIIDTRDCNGDPDGTAFIDNCETCVGGKTGKTACTQDCAGVWGGNAKEPNVTIGKKNEVCGNDNGVVKFSFPDEPSRTNIEFSTDGGLTYPKNVYDNVGSTSITDLSKGSYHLYARWGNDECPVDLGTVNLEARPAPSVSVSKKGADCGTDNGAITLTFPDESTRTGIEFSLDNGTTYPIQVKDNTGSYSFEGLARGDYHVWTRWGNDDCPVDLGVVTIGGPSCNYDCNGDLDGTAFIDNCETCVEGKTGKTACVQDCKGIWGGNAAEPDVTTSVQEENCEQSDGSIKFSFPDQTGRSAIEFSLDGGLTYPTQVKDNIGNTTISDLAPGTYDVWTRWGNDECPVDLGELVIKADPNPITTTLVQSSECGANNGSITFNFDDTKGRSRIEFSTDGGASYPTNVRDNTTSITVPYLAPGTYDIWVRWGNNDCPVDLGYTTILEIPCGYDCNNVKNGTAYINDFGICVDASVENTPCVYEDYIDPLSTEDLLEEFMVYPNPTSGMISFSKNVNFQIIDLLGNVILKGRGNHTDLSSQSSGIYFIKVNHSIVKVIKK